MEKPGGTRRLCPVRMRREPGTAGDEATVCAGRGFPALDPAGPGSVVTRSPGAAGSESPQGDTAAAQPPRRGHRSASPGRRRAACPGSGERAASRGHSRPRGLRETESAGTTPGVCAALPTRPVPVPRAGPLCVTCRCHTAALTVARRLHGGPGRRRLAWGGHRGPRPAPARPGRKSGPLS